jgi:hypothetical protein
MLHQAGKAGMSMDEFLRSTPGQIQAKLVGGRKTRPLTDAQARKLQRYMKGDYDDA